MALEGLFDHSDDPTGKILVSNLGPSLGPAVMQKVAEVNYKELPDSAFALVVAGKGETLRKFACINPETTLASLVYFAASTGHIPTALAKTAAVNLSEACKSFGLKVPSMISEFNADEDTLNVVVRDKNDYSLDDLSGYLLKEASVPKNFAYKEEGLFSTSTKEAATSSIKEFEKMAHTLSPDNKREVAKELSTRCQAWGVSPSEFISKHASNQRSEENLNVGINLRLTRLNDIEENEPHREALHKLASAVNDLEDSEIVDAFKEIDRRAGFDYKYTQVPDPFQSVFGLAKEAGFTFLHGNDRVTGDQLGILAENPTVLKNNFTEEFVSAFKSDPVTIFESLPLPQKLVLCRVANDIGTSNATPA
ncbi:hypothetical protein LCGC14_0147160 [marine sediment metagenome]|uniref:Uncharacterized protein n=1 Tax=marine sediment metagenome TaxID=412755 RepID=A0A0F9V3M7_9ZZZZ